MGRLVDGFGRRFRYLRLSVTEVCNYRCTYCLPDGFKKSGAMSFLTPDEIDRVVRAFAGFGVAKLRLTGGEPSVRRDLVEIIARAAATPGIDKVAVTTNGWNLRRNAAAWRDAGLTNLNVSIDSLDPAAFHRITGHDQLKEVVAGLDLALALGTPTVKVNAVLLRDTVETGFDAFTDFVRDRPISLRFIELMRTGDNAAYFDDQHVSGVDLQGWLAARGWTPVAKAFDDGPATDYAHPDHAGRIGLIAPYAPGFCDSCNRLRVTSRGALRLCLFGELGVNLRDLLVPGQEEALQARIQAALVGKPAGHRLHENNSGDTRQLAQFGG
ncbi:cyclic pyranopterin phosphate synthase MoaA [Caulobacter sp. Root1455]|jgi:cyclic pyranopterin phosphate synthase|uniref:GTP 3',8-cyclase MoaA n=1 Tax=Caulobacter sp. Root1455 TaxID=1736465 RepID=UPI0006FDA1C2|nr:GTP 3',8-cyclase MoaA [Caulobacter sp. Root1455]KQY91439.1 cyclic pyranopterin phosphate synthase MoaA [Caulobacter sp. Root1455]